jgi:hypothetical protein
MIVLSRRVERKRFEESLQISQEEKDDYLDANLAAQGPPAANRLFRVWVEVADPRRHDAATLASLRESLPGILQDYIAQAPRPTEDGPPAAADNDVPEAVRALAKHDAPYCRFTWSDAGYVPLETLSLLQSPLQGVRAGEFSPVERMGDAAVSYYVAAEKVLNPKEREDLEAQYHWSLAAARRDDLAQAQRLSVTRDLAIAFCF